MRRLKFRAWDVEEKRFFKPTYEAYVGRLEDLSIEFTGDLIRRTLDMPAEHESLFPDRYIVTQWTGLQDKNGKDIYEGDIATHDGKPGALVSSPYGIPPKYGTGEAFIFATIECGLVARHISAVSNDMFDIPNAIINGWKIIDPYQLWNLQRGFEIIGNIYENPELLK